MPISARMGSGAAPELADSPDAEAARGSPEWLELYYERAKTKELLDLTKELNDLSKRMKENGCQ